MSSVNPTGDLNKHKVAISTSMSPTGDPNKHKSVVSISNCISLLYEWMKILISVIVICLLQMCICIRHMFPTKRKA